MTAAGWIATAALAAIAAWLAWARWRCREDAQQLIAETEEYLRDRAEVTG
jgi:hypothetical protein